MCVLNHKHRRRGSGAGGGHNRNLVCSGAAPEQGAVALTTDPTLVEEAGEGPGVSRGGALDFRVLMVGALMVRAF